MLRILKLARAVDMSCSNCRILDSPFMCCKEDMLLLLLCWCFTALRHLSGHFERGQSPRKNAAGRQDRPRDRPCTRWTRTPTELPRPAKERRCVWTLRGYCRIAVIYHAVWQKNVQFITKPEERCTHTSIYKHKTWSGLTALAPCFHRLLLPSSGM